MKRLIPAALLAATLLVVGLASQASAEISLGIGDFSLSIGSPPPVYVAPPPPVYVAPPPPVYVAPPAPVYVAPAPMPAYYVEPGHRHTHPHRY